MSEIKTPEDQTPPPLPGPEDRIRPVSNDMPVKHADEMFCSNCGAIIKIKSLSCPRCGKKQRKDGMGCLPMAAIGIAIVFVGFFIIGILAAIAIPQFNAYRTRAYQASVKAELNEICKAEDTYFTKNEKYTDNLEELGYIAKPNISIKIINLEDDCFYAQGEMKNLNKKYVIDCDCAITEEAIESIEK
jgi:type IV pilus assembly protein PilA